MPQQDTSSTPFDVAVLGGGIAGAAIARDAALRGLKVLLLEKKTFGSGTSSTSSKLIHGGLRYLELAWNALWRGRFGEFRKNLSFVFVSLREAQILETIAPDLAKPLPILLPIYRTYSRSRFEIAVGTFLYYVLARLSGRKARAPKFFGNPAELARLMPGLRQEGLIGGVQIWDRLTDDVRLVRETVASAVRHGATAHEHAAVLSYQREAASGLYRVRVRLNGTEQNFEARTLVNATGPWVDLTRRLSRDASGEDYVLPVAGAHIETRKLAPMSLLLQSKDGRIFFVISLKDRSRIGTTERRADNPDVVAPTPQEIEYLLTETNRYLPGAKLTASDILSSDAGIRPLVKPAQDQNPHDVSREHALHVDAEGVFHLVGVKLTDHRRAGEKTVDRVLKELTRTAGKPFVKSRTATVPLSA